MARGRILTEWVILYTKALPTVNGVGCVLWSVVWSFISAVTVMSTAANPGAADLIVTTTASGKFCICGR